MKKIISLFQRNYDGDRLVRDEVVPGAEWVINGEGIATRKLDGTACMVKNGRLYKRYDVSDKYIDKHGVPPADFIPAQDRDPVSRHWPGWLPVSESDPSDKWHREAMKESPGLTDGTYELIGHKIQGNPEAELCAQGKHFLARHGAIVFNDIYLGDPPRTFNELKEWFFGKDIEGIVWHHPDGRMVKIKARDFGLKRGAA